MVKCLQVYISSFYCNIIQKKLVTIQTTEIYPWRKKKEEFSFNPTAVTFDSVVGL